MSKLIFGFLLLLSFKNFCQQPDTDIWLCGIKTDKGKVSFSKPENITGRKGYDNQPCFSADNKLIYFTSLRDTAPQTDIFIYNISTRQTTQYTFSKNSEYSPTLSPDGKGLSAVVVEENAAQRIWEYPFSGGAPYRMFDKSGSIGYFTWRNTGSVLAFVLPENKTEPVRLSLLAPDGSEKPITEKIGRGMKGYKNFALFIKKVDSLNYIYFTDYSKIKELIKVPGTSEDFAIYKDEVYMCSEGTIYIARIHFKKKEITGMTDFVPVQDLSEYGLHKITRIAISSDGKVLALVNTQ